MTDPIDSLTVALAGRYAVERELGRGGMATVYLAEDLRHHRKVAIKVLLPQIAAAVGTDRFLREIDVTANLQHPNILPLYDSGCVERPGASDAESATLLYYVMPYIEGESLRDTLNRETQLSVEETVAIARSVTAALQYAHDHGVVHRDIKPENILLQSGQALVADFGIALAISQAGGARLTQTGVSVGTPVYMSPEQATGARRVDARSDVYSLGCVLYEMLAGTPPHTGPTAQAVIARIVADEPTPVGVQRRNLPPQLTAAVDRALQKLPADRFRSAKEFADALDGNLATPVPARAGTRTGHGGTRAWQAATVALALSSILLGVVALRALHGVAPRAEMKIQVTWPADQAPLTTTGFALSPDGTQLVYRGPDRRLWLRELNELTAHPIPGTASAENPFFSPDGRSIAFFTRSPHSLDVVDVDGGPVRTLVQDSADVYGGDWTRDGMLYYSGILGGIWRVPARGGRPERVSRPDSAKRRLPPKWVDVLPNGKGALLSIWSGATGSAEVGVLNLKTGRVSPLFRGTYARYTRPGRVLYTTPEGRLVAVSFDEDRLTATGAPTPIADSVLGDVYFGRAQFAVSESGTLLYKPVDTQSREELVWVTREGSTTPVDTTLRGSFNSLALSPDGQRIAITLDVPGRQDIWVKDLKLGSLTRVTLESEGSVNYRPHWTANGRSLTFVSDRTGPTALWLQPLDGSRPAKIVASDPGMIDEGFLTADGAWIIYRTFGRNQNTRDIYALRVAGMDTTQRPLAATPPDEFSPALSPNGRWLAYVSEESGRAEVYVRPFPDASAARWTVSVDGGTDPVWAHSGRRLFYLDAHLELMAVDVAADSTFRWSAPRALFDASSFSRDYYHAEYAVTPDDRRFLMVRPIAQGESPFVLVVNWSEELR